MLSDRDDATPETQDVAVDLVFSAVASRNAFEETVERLMRAIKLGLVRYGEPLPPERALAPKLGVSRVTLREAIRALQRAGYVESRRGRSGGTFVIHRPRHSPSERTARKIAKEMGSEAILDALRFRGVIEPAAAELAAKHADGPDAQRLERLVEQAAEVPAADYRAADSRIHLAIAEMAQTPSLTSAIADVQIRLTDLLAAIPRLEQAVLHANEQHEAIVRAIARGEPDAARAAMEEHVGATATLIRGFLV